VFYSIALCLPSCQEIQKLTSECVDWEFPAFERTDSPNWSFRANDNENLAQWCEETKSYWTKQGKADWLLTVALRAVAKNGTPAVWGRLGSIVDYGLLMAYEYHHNNVRTRGGNPLVAGPGDNADEKESTVEAGCKSYTAAGFPKSKLVVGVPLYAVGWTGLNEKGPFRDNIPGFGFPIDKGVTIAPPTPYSEIVYMVKTNVQKNWRSTFDPVRGYNVHFNGSTVYFLDSPESMGTKAKWIVDNGYAGIMIWNSNQDIPDNKEGSLMTAINQHFAIKPSEQAPFCVDGPSPFCNLQCSFLKQADPSGKGDALGKPRSAGNNKVLNAGSTFLIPYVGMLSVSFVWVLFMA
jgi:GH18 family chitinase